MASLGGLLLSKVTLFDIVKFICVYAFMHKRLINRIDWTSMDSVVSSLLWIQPAQDVKVTT